MSRFKDNPRPLGYAFFVVFTLVTALAFTGVYRKPFEAKSRNVVADFDRAAQLYPGDEVRISGDIDGKVTKVQRAPGSPAARVTMAVDSSAGPIFSDASARLQAKTLLAGSYYVDIDRGTPSNPPLGHSVIPRERTNVQVEVDDVTDVFRGQALTGFKALPDQLAKGLSDTPAVAGDVGTVDRIAPDAGTALGAVRGEIPGYDLRRVVQGAAKTVRALDSNNEDLYTLVSGAAATLQTTGRRAADIRQTIRSLPSVTYDLTNTFHRLDTTLDVADGLIARLRPSAPKLAPALRGLNPALVQTRGVLTRAEPLLRQALPLLTNLGTLGESGTPLAHQVQPALHDLNTTILPYLNAVDPDTGHTTAVMIGGTAAGFGGAADQLDENGHFIRFPASVGASSAYVPCRSSLIDPGESSLLACDSFNQAVQNYLKYLPKFGGTSVPPASRKGGR